MKRVLLFAILFATTTTGNTEPTPAVRYLINEPVTLFDLGMLRLDEDFSNLAKRDSASELNLNATVIVKYWWHENRISIGMHMFSNKVESVQSRKNFCKEGIAWIKHFLGVDAQTGKPLYKPLYRASSSNLVGYFSHIGFSTKSEPKNIAAELDTITELSVSLFTKPSDLTKCKSALLSKEVLFPE